MNLKLQSVRLSYPALFEPKSGPEGGEPKYSAAFLLHKEHNAQEVKAMRDAILSVAAAQWGAPNVKWDNDALKLKLSNGNGAIVKTCLRDGSEKAETPGYGDEVKFFTANNKMQPAIVDKNPSNALTKADGRPYAGCNVNAAVRLWAQDNKFGKRVNAQLQAVQFVSDGESFGEAPVDPTSVFGNVDNSGRNEEARNNSGEGDIPF